VQQTLLQLIRQLLLSQPPPRPTLRLPQLTLHLPHPGAQRRTLLLPSSRPSWV
jgi:hypothetical protein